MKVEGGFFIGGFTGINRATGKISDSFAFGPDAYVHGNANYIGGFSAVNEGLIERSYSIIGTVKGADYVGGFIGSMADDASSEVRQSYAYSEVDAPAGSSYVGGFIGENKLADHSNVQSSFWSPQVANVSASAGGTSRQPAQFIQEATFTNAGWNFSGADPDWEMPQSTGPEGAPYTPDLTRNSRF